MDKFSLRTTILIGFLFLAAGVGLSVAVQVMGKATNRPVSYECHFPKVKCTPASSSDTAAKLDRSGP
jgi:hypothetical protein